MFILIDECMRFVNPLVSGGFL